MPEIVFWLALYLPGHAQPITFDAPMPSVAARLYEVHELLVRAPHIAILAGGSVQAGCVVTFPPSEEH